jgi:hypothetical protein
MHPLWWLYWIWAFLIVLVILTAIMAVQDLLRRHIESSEQIELDRRLLIIKFMTGGAIVALLVLARLLLFGE